MASKLERKTVENSTKSTRPFADIENSQLCGIIDDRGSEMSGYRDL
ncbi:MAG: hypothetical protein N2Z22_00240 [Turneriella sp.]|nr:hypothetical protein [Turneriella sp.]